MSRSLDSTTPRRRSLATCALLPVFMLACQPATVSVGDLECSDADGESCERFAPEHLNLRSPLWYLVPEDVSAEVLWKRAVIPLQPCASAECKLDVDAFLVHDDGEVVIAGVLHDPDPVQLLVSWYDSQGELVFQTPVPASTSDAVDGVVFSPPTLVRTPDGQTLLLQSYGADDGKGGQQGKLEAHAISRSGEITVALGIDTDLAWPDAHASLDSGVLIGGHIATTVELMSYSQTGEMLWRQPRVAFVPRPQDVGFEVGDDVVPQLQALALDSRGRIWAVLHEGLVGIVQLQPEGEVEWHGWAPVAPEALPGLLTATASLLAIDSRDRPVVAAQGTIARLTLDPAAPHGERGSLIMGTADQQYYYPPHADSLALDAQDRIYVGTQDGPRSARRVVIDRFAEDFTGIERFTLPPDDDVHTGRIQHLHIAEDGDAYVHHHGDPYDLADARSGSTIDEYNYIARLRLPDDSASPAVP